MSLLDDPTLWKQRALQMREIADAEPEVGIKKALIDLAERYEGLADRAEKRRDAPEPRKI